MENSKSISNGSVFSPVEYDVTTLLSDIVDYVNNHIGEKKINFKLDIKNDLPEKLYGDNLIIKQIICSLLRNSIKYTQEGLIKLSIEYMRDSETDIWLDIIVSDYGVGINEDKLKHIFKNCDEDDIYITEDADLNLPIIKELVQMMDGDITAKSIEGFGSVFYVGVSQRFVTDIIIEPALENNLCYLPESGKGAEVYEGCEE